MDQRKEIKEALEQILGSSITMRDDGSDPVDELKNDFIKLIDLYESVWKRQNDLLEVQGLDFTSYDENYFRLVEGFIHFCFEGVAADAILFYIYSRKDEDGTLHPFMDSKGQEHTFETIDDLWEFLLYWAEEMMRP
jgi:hypothetical protein